MWLSSIFIPMKKVGFIYDDIYLEHKTPLGHPESPQRLIEILNAIKESTIWDNLIHIKPRRCDIKDILTVHTEDYYHKIESFIGYYDPDTYISDKSFESALYSAGAVIEAIDRCYRNEIERAFCAVRPPGHHAEADKAKGFCIFNNIAIGAKYAQKIGFKKVFIIDFDVHHGNGTQHIFEEDDSVFYFSTHQYPHYPGTGMENEKGKGKGEGYTSNFPLKYGSNDRDYFSIYHKRLPNLAKWFNPDIILVSAGYDIHKNDPLSDIYVSNEGIMNIIKGILLCQTYTNKSTLPFIFALEGGYNLNALSESVIITIKEMLAD